MSDFRSWMGEGEGSDFQRTPFRAQSSPNRPGFTATGRASLPPIANEPTSPTLPEVEPAQAAQAERRSADRSEPAEPQVDVEALVAQAVHEATQPLQAEIERLQGQNMHLGPLLDELDRARAEARQAAARDVASIVMLAVRRLVGSTLAADPTVVAAMITDAVHTMPEEDRVVVRVAPDAVDDVVAVLGPDVDADRVVGDPTIAGGCVVQTRYAAIDNTLDALLEGIDGAVSDWLRRSDP